MTGRKVIGLDYERALREGEADALSEYDMPHSFTVQAEDGFTMHVNGDPRMGDETLAAIVEVARLALAQYARKGGAA